MYTIGSMTFSRTLLEGNTECMEKSYGLPPLYGAGAFFIIMGVAVFGNRRRNRTL